MDLRKEIYFYANLAAFPATGALNCLYVASATGIIYTWNGSSYVASGPGPVPTGLNYQGLWDANANLPLITSSVGTVGNYYIVGTAGTTNINGINDWGVGDWIVFSSTGVWQKIDNSDKEGYATIEDEGNPLTQRSTINFVGAGVSAADSGGKTVVTIAAGGLTNFTEAANSSAPNATVPVNSLTATGAATNIDAAIVPKGTGALLAAVPDNLTAGGNKRGQYAVDWQMLRNANFRIASGNRSVIIGGYNNGATNTYSIVGGESNESNGYGSIVFGVSNTANNTCTIALGTANNISGDGSAGIGASNTITAGRNYAFAAGGNNTISTSGQYQTAIGYNNTVSNNVSVGIGFQNTASGSAAVALGQQNTASGTNAFATGILGLASGNYSSVVGGYGSTASGVTSIAGGDGCVASATWAVALGGSNSADATSSVALGLQSSAFGIYGRNVFASGQEGTKGDSQTSKFVLRERTTGNTATTLTTNSSAASTNNQVILSNQSAYRFKGSIVGKQSGSTNAAVWDIDGFIVRGANAAATTLNVSNVNLVQNTPAWGTPTLAADTTNGGLQVQVTGAAATNIQWTAVIETTEVIYA